MLEEIRYTSIAPLLAPHMASEDGELGSYLVPKGTQVNVFTFPQRFSL